MERSFAWLGNYRRLLIRWEHVCMVYEAFFAVAIMLVCLRMPISLSSRSVNCVHLPQGWVVSSWVSLTEKTKIS